MKPIINPIKSAELRAAVKPSEPIAYHKLLITEAQLQELDTYLQRAEQLHIEPLAEIYRLRAIVVCVRAWHDAEAISRLTVDYLFSVPDDNLLTICNWLMFRPKTENERLFVTTPSHKSDGGKPMTARKVETLLRKALRKAIVQ